MPGCDTSHFRIIDLMKNKQLHMHCLSNTMSSCNQTRIMFCNLNLKGKQRASKCKSNIPALMNVFYLLFLQCQTGEFAEHLGNKTHLNYTNHMRKQAIHPNFQQHYQCTANIFAYFRLLITSQCKKILLEKQEQLKNLNPSSSACIIIDITG